MDGSRSSAFSGLICEEGKIDTNNYGINAASRSMVMYIFYSSFDTIA